MNKSEIRKKVGEVIAQTAEREYEEIKDVTTLEQLELDSLTYIEIVFELETAFDIIIPDHDTEKLNNLDDAVIYIHDKIMAKTLVEETP